MFHFEPGVALWTLVSFVIVLVVIQRYVYPPVRKIFKIRTQTIDENIASAEKQRILADERTAELEERMHSVHQEEERILLEARERARTLRAEYERKALDDIRELRRSREADLRKLEDGFYEQNQQEFTNLVMHTCERVLRTSIPPDLQHVIIDQRITELERLERL